MSLLELAGLRTTRIPDVGTTLGVGARLARLDTHTWRMTMLNEGDAAPDFAVSDQDGNSKSLKDYAGQNLFN